MCESYQNSIVKKVCQLQNFQSKNFGGNNIWLTSQTKLKLKELLSKEKENVNFMCTQSESAGRNGIWHDELCRMENKSFKSEYMRLQKKNIKGKETNWLVQGLYRQIRYIRLQCISLCEKNQLEMLNFPSRCTFRREQMFVSFFYFGAKKNIRSKICLQGWMDIFLLLCIIITCRSLCQTLALLRC